MFGPKLNCFFKFMIKANFVIDYKVRSELPKKEQMFVHLHIARKPRLQTYISQVTRKDAKNFFSVVINARGGFFDENKIVLNSHT